VTLNEAKWGPTKTFLCANIWKYYFLLVWLDCYVNDVCLSCLLNNIVNQHNPCALVIMPLFMCLAIFPEPLSWQPLPFAKLFYLSKTRAKIYLWEKAFIKTKYLQNYRELQSTVVPLFYKLIFCWYYNRISNTFKKTW
jgi:hypothetical protein